MTHDPISMCIYGIGLLPHSPRSQGQELPFGTTMWSETCRKGQSEFDAIWHHFQQLKEIGPNFGYYPESSKSILVVPQHNYKAAHRAFTDLQFTVTTGHHYLGSLIDEDRSSRE
jgi:hypothetical protein